jgi:1,4-alpha-glucan branching enzyme
MTFIGNDTWIRDARLAIGGNPNPPPPPFGIPGAWQYKFYYQGLVTWPNDPLNHHVNPRDNDNSFIIVKDPTIYHFLPNQRAGIVQMTTPTISAYIFPKVGTVVDTSTLSLDIDGTLYTNIGGFYDFATQQLNFVPPLPLPNGGHTVILQAGTNSDSVLFVTLPQIPILPMPGYANHGVTLPSPASNDSTTFRIRVSGTTAVILRVAPLGQPVSAATPVVMRKNPVTHDWWMNLSLPTGTYEYLYQTDSGTDLYDPWGRWNGTEGTRFSTASEGLTADDYGWQSNEYQRPPLNKLIMYELHVGEFAGGYYGLPAGQATFAHLTTLLPHFDSLGVNAIELMPINDFGLVGQSGHSWGYDLNHYFALEPAYGTPWDFKVLVDSAHALGIAVIVDVVFNHLNDTGPLWQMQPDVVSNPYFKANNDLRFNEDPLFFFTDMDHWTDETQELIYEVLKMWIDQYRVDGFRYDFTQGIGWNINEPTRGILGWSNRIDLDYSGTVYQIAEHLPESAALILHSGLTGGWHDSFHDEVFDEARFRNTPLIDFENLVIDLQGYPGNDTPSSPTRYADRTEPVNANVNHDEQSLIYEMVTFQGVSLPEALLRDKLYASFMFASLGIPMLWQGMEFSAPRGWMDGNQKLSYRPLEWHFLDSARGQSHYQYYQALIRQRRYNPALHDGELRKLFRYNSEKVLVWGFEDSTSGAKFMAVSNLSGAQRTVANVPWLAPGDWYDIFDQSVFTVGSTTVPSFTLPAYTAKLYSNLSDSVLLPVRGSPLGIPTEFALDQNYPNPFNPTTTIRFQLPQSSFVRLMVYDLLGREVAKLVEGGVNAGLHVASWDGRRSDGLQVGSGVYFYRLEAGSFSQIMKMLLLK